MVDTKFNLKDRNVKCSADEILDILWKCVGINYNFKRVQRLDLNKVHNLIFKVRLTFL